MLKIEKPVFNPYLAVLLGVVAVSFASVFTKLATAPPLIIAFYRLGITVLLLSPLALNRFGRTQLKSVRRRDLALASVAGAFLALHFSVWITSLNYTSIASSTVLVTMQPLFVVTLGALFMGEKIGLKGVSGAAVALSGSILIGVGDFRIGGEALWGDMLAFLGAFFVAVYVLIGRNLRARLSLFPYVFLVYGTAAIFLLVLNLSGRIPLYPYPAGDWLCFLALAVLPTIFGHTVFNWALRYVKASIVSVSILGEPVGASLLGYLILHQAPGLLQMAGGCLIIGGVYLFIVADRVPDQKE